MHEVLQEKSISFAALICCQQTMNQKRPSIAPMNSPTLDRLEMQPQSTPSWTTQNPTNPTPAAAVPPSTAAASTLAGPLKTSIHVTALDGIVNVNSLFTMAIFIGFSLTVPANASAASRAECTTSPETIRRLIVVEVISFSFFLFSSLIAQSLKLAINLLNSLDSNDPHKAYIDPNCLKYGLFASAIGSVVGCLFLMLSILDFIQVKLGSFTCGGKSLVAMVILVVFVGSALLVYVSTAVYASFFVKESSGGPSTRKNRK